MSNFIFLHVDIQFSQYHLLKRLSVPYCMILAPLSKIIWSYIQGFVSRILFCTIGLYVCPYANTTLLWLMKVFSKIWNQKVKVSQLCSYSKLFWLFRISLWLHMNFRTGFSISEKKKYCWGYDRDCIESEDHFGVVLPL